MTTLYPYIPEGKTIRYVPFSHEYMREAERVCNEDSTDYYHKTGAVVVQDGRIIGRGANQSRVRNKYFQEIHKRYLCIRRLFKIPSGTKYWMCPGCSSYKHHAEATAVRNALSHSRSIVGADLYLYGHWWCCKPCWDTMIAAGVKDVYLVENATDLFA